MNIRLWSRLPLEIVEQTLSFLPVPALCKFRTVCKRWNSLICNPKFGALWIRNVRQDACCIVAWRYTVKGEAGESDGRGWIFLNPNARRWYTITDLVDAQELSDCLDHGSLHGFFKFCAGCVSKDGWDEELVYQTLLTAITGHENGLILSPDFTSYPSITVPLGPGDPVVTALVDSSEHDYEISVMPNGDLTSDGRLISADDPLMILYDPETDQWQSSVIPPMLLHSWDMFPAYPLVPTPEQGPLLCFGKPLNVLLPMSNLRKL